MLYAIGSRIKPRIRRNYSKRFLLLRTSNHKQKSREGVPIFSMNEERQINQIKYQSFSYLRRKALSSVVKQDIEESEHLGYRLYQCNGTSQREATKEAMDVASLVHVQGCLQLCKDVMPLQNFHSNSVKRWTPKLSYKPLQEKKHQIRLLKFHYSILYLL